MPHNLFGERFLGHNDAAWHKLGTVFTDPLTAVEAVMRSGLDYQILKRPLAYEVDGTYHTVPGQVALVREPTTDDPTHRAFGYVSESFGLLNNLDLAHIFDLHLTKEMPVETMGALGHGETVFMTLKAGDGEIVPGEHYQGYYLVTDKRDGASALTIAYTPIRVVCQNTLSSGLSAATARWDLAHTPGLRTDVEVHVKIAGQLKAAREATIAAMTALAQTKVTPDQAVEIIAAAYPEPKKTTRLLRMESLKELGVVLDQVAVASYDRMLADFESQQTNFVKLRDGCFTKYDQFNDEFDTVARTAWAAYNAVVEHEDFGHGEGKRAAESAIFGERAATKVRAFRTAASIAGVN